MHSKRLLRIFPGGALALVLALPAHNLLAALYHAQGEMAGEVTASGVILQSRLTASDGPRDGDVPGASGMACFEYAETADFVGALKTGWLKAEAEKDFIVRTRVGGLKAGARYFYRLVYGPTESETRTGPVRSFKTLPGEKSDAEVSFVVVTGMNYSPFMSSRSNGGAKATATPEDKRLGYPAMEVMRKLKPDFFVGTGDNVYYDNPAKPAARTLPELRRKWHEQFVLPRLVAFFGETAAYWEKDDHDFRYNDCDLASEKEPLPDLGIRTFLEQVPLADPDDAKPLSYRTHRVNRHLQLWFTEGRDYRSPNKEPDGPDKTLWGRDQREWLKRTLLASDVTWRVLISPTPMVGPDDAYKSDNHVNPKGFRQEGEAFFQWLKENRVANLFVICGDRHWQYHSIHPSGYEEFSCGALCDENSRLGRAPGNKASTDPDALIKQPYTQSEPSGGFLRVVVKPAPDRGGATLACEYYDDTGKVQYTHTKRGRF